MSATLTGAAEAPGPGDPDGSGTANVRVNPGQECISYDITVQNIEPATAAHIHEAPAGEPGGIVVPQDGSTLDPPTGSGTEEVDRDRAKDLVQNPEKYYVNVHNAEFGSGAVRGQLSK